MPTTRPLSEEAIQLVARRFAALAEPMRLRLVQALYGGELSVSALVKATGGTQANVSRHLQTLIQANILTRRKDGLQVLYAIADSSIRQLCGLVCGSVEKQLARQIESFEPQDNGPRGRS